jgi:putative FmdB family regulatory protein
MPLYEYECGACGHRFEIIQKFSDVPITECPECRGRLRKLQSAPAFQLKGTGWYATDYPKTGQTPPEKDSDGSSDSSASEKAAAKEDKSEKTEKSDKTEKADKSQKSDTSGKGGTTEKKTDKTDKGAAAKDVSSSSSTAGSKAAKSET